MAEHAPVMVTEVVEKLLHRSEGIYVDATFGRGGHSRALLAKLSPRARLIGLDRDQAAIDAGQLLAATEPRFTITKCRFGGLASALASMNISQVDGILLDIGVSSPQLDDPSRGFSFRADGPLDMRMDTSTGETAGDWLNHAPVDEIAKVLRDLGEEKFAKRIAQRIVDHRPVEKTLELAEIISGAIPARSRSKESKHPATRSFQAIRMHINDELGELDAALESAWRVLNPGGRLAVISFHSLEDRAVKQQFRAWSQPPDLPRRMPIREEMLVAEGRLLGKPIKAGRRETEENPRARSAILRVIEKMDVTADA